MTGSAGVLQRFVHSQLTPALPDAELIGRFARQEDQDAFAEIVRRHGPLVFGVCRRIVGDRHEAEDAFQATFFVLARKAGGLQQPERLAPWLHGVASRVARKARLRNQRRELIAPLDSEPAAADREDAALDIQPLLDEAVLSLPLKYREPVILCYLQGLTNDEAARALGCPTGTVATRLARARAQLRRRLERRGVAVPAALFPAILASAAGAVELPDYLLETTPIATAQPVADGINELIRGAEKSMIATKGRWLAGTLLVLVAGGVGVVGFRASAEQPGQSGTPPKSVTEPPTYLVPFVDSGTVDPDRPAIETPNFSVSGVPPRVARLIAESAERHRKEVAERWLGKALPNWPEPCPIEVRINDKGSPGGATTFAFLERKIEMRMRLEGSLDRLLADTLPHEVTHTVLATHFGKSVPRWADEGIAMLNESPEEQQRHQRLFHELAAERRNIKLDKLFKFKDYPDDVMVLFAQGFSVTHFLVERKDRPTLLKFVKDGMDSGWDKAAKKHYGFGDVAELEQSWLDSLHGKEIAPPESAESLGLPKSPGPQTAVAFVDGDSLRVGRTVHLTEPRTEYVARKVDNKTFYQQVTSYRSTFRHQYLAYAAKAVKAFETDGKPIATKALRERLKNKTVVLIADEEKVDPFYLQLIKPGTIILVLPLVGEPEIQPPPATPDLEPPPVRP
jgi:RNA polymerase sigma factor (sigma-70 family)